MTVLVAVASRHGATHEIAEAVGRGLSAAGIANEVRSVEDFDDLDAYAAIVLGSAVYVGSWLDDAKRFVGRHAAQMRGLPVWLFSSGPIGDPPHPSDDHAVQIDEIMTTTGARGHRVVTGRLDKHLLGFGERAVVLAVRAPEGDFRDWDAVTAWAGEIADALAGSGR